MVSGRSTGLVAALSLLLAAQAESAEPPTQPRGELLLFPSAEVHTIQGSEIEDSSADGWLALDVLGSWTAGRFRVLGELFLTTDEQELERLQAGWEVVPETMLWIGRFHQPASPWNTRNHHGSYLQTGITRPAIEDWEDDGGVLPQHIEGLLAESRIALGESRGLMLSAAAGIAPELVDGELEPFDIVDPRSENRGPAFAAQAAFLPDYSGSDAVGLVASHSEIMLGDDAGLGGAAHVDLGVAGAFLDLSRGPWRFTSTVYWIRSHFAGVDHGEVDSFVSGYVQAQRRFGDKVTALARIEASSGAEGSDYIALFDDFVDDRNVVGLRWDFVPHHALTVEWADTETLHDRYREYRLQWSATLR